MAPMRAAGADGRAEKNLNRDNFSLLTHCFDLYVLAKSGRSCSFANDLPLA
jgi:hypothetical protein